MTRSPPLGLLGPQPQLSSGKRALRRSLLANGFLVIFGLLLLLSSHTATAQPELPELFEPVQETLESSQTPLRLHPGQRIIRHVRLNIDLLSPRNDEQVSINRPRRLSLSLSDQERYIAELSEISIQSPSRYMLRGNIENVVDSRVIVAVRGETAAAEISIGPRLFEIRNQSGDIYAVIEVDRAVFPPEAEPLSVPITPDEPHSTVPGNVAQATCFLNVDVMVLYTDDARAAAGGVTNIELLIDLAVDRTNEAYQRSGVTQRVNLVHTEEVNFTENNDSSAMLEQLKNKNDGIIDHIHQLRNSHVADIVSMIIENRTDCGRGYQMSTLSSSFAGNAFNIASRTCAAGNLSFAHELGHNMGIAHDKANSGGGAPVFTYAYGYQNPDTNQTTNFRTVMAYDCTPNTCPRVSNFSNPSVNYNGVPTGISGSADNAFALNRTRCVVSSWRICSSGRPSCPPGYWCSEPGEPPGAGCCLQCTPNKLE
jgi:peptidyl-Asp metalloendopeptidase